MADVQMQFKQFDENIRLKQYSDLHSAHLAGINSEFIAFVFNHLSLRLSGGLRISSAVSSSH